MATTSRVPATVIGLLATPDESAAAAGSLLVGAAEGAEFAAAGSLIAGMADSWEGAAAGSLLTAWIIPWADDGEKYQGQVIAEQPRLQGEGPLQGQSNSFQG